MKRLFLLLIFIPVVSFGQTDSSFIPSYKANSNIQLKPQHKTYRGRTILLFATSIILDAVGDALNDSGEKEVGHVCAAASVATLLTVPFLTNVDKKKWYIYALSYTSLRMGLFDPSYNVARGVDINYIGCTCSTDKTMRANNIQSNLFARGFFVGVGIALPLCFIDSKY